MGERPGEYKKHDYVTGKEEVGASPEDIAEEVGELLAELQDVPDGKSLTAAHILMRWKRGTLSKTSCP